MKGSLVFFIFFIGFVLVLLVNISIEQILTKGNGNIRITKTCVSGRKRTATELKEIKRRAIEKALKKKQLDRNRESTNKYKPKYDTYLGGICPPVTYKFLLMSFSE